MLRFSNASPPSSRKHDDDEPLGGARSNQSRSHSFRNVLPIQRYIFVSSLFPRRPTVQADRQLHANFVCTLSPRRLPHTSTRPYNRGLLQCIYSPRLTYSCNHRHMRQRARSSVKHTAAAVADTPPYTRQRARRPCRRPPSWTRPRSTTAATAVAVVAYSLQRLVDLLSHTSRKLALTPKQLTHHGARSPVPRLPNHVCSAVQ